MSNIGDKSNIAGCSMKIVDSGNVEDRSVTDDRWLGANNEDHSVSKDCCNIDRHSVTEYCWLQRYWRSVSNRRLLTAAIWKIAQLAKIVEIGISKFTQFAIIVDSSIIENRSVSEDCWRQLNRRSISLRRLFTAPELTLTYCSLQKMAHNNSINGSTWDNSAFFLFDVVKAVELSFFSIDSVEEVSALEWI